MFGVKSHLQQFVPIILICMIATGTFGQVAQGYQQRPAIRYLSGATPGTSIDYSAYLKSSSTDGTGMTYVQSILVKYVSGSKVEYKQSFSYQNGTTNTPVVSYLIDVRDGSETKFFDTFVFPSSPKPQFFLARGLADGDPVLDPTIATQHFLTGLKVNGTKVASYAGNELESDFLSISRQGENLSLYWEKESGILLEFVVSGGGYFFSLQATHIDLPSANPTLDPPVSPSLRPGPPYRSMARVVVVGVKDISQEIAFQALKQGDTKDIQIPATPDGYDYGFVQLFGISSPRGISADFHGFDKIAIGTGEGDLGLLVNLTKHAIHKTADDRPIIYFTTGNNAPQVTILHRDDNLLANSSDVRLKVYASFTTYKESYQEIVGNTMRLLVPPSPDASVFDSWQVYIMVGPDSPLRVASVMLPNGTEAGQRVATVLPKTVILRDSIRPFGTYEIKFEEWYGLPMAGIMRVDRMKPGENPPVHQGWSDYFTAVSESGADHYYVADTSRAERQEVLIDASAGYFVGAVSGYAYIGLPDVALLKSGTFEREFLAILAPSSLASVISFEPPGTMYMDFYLDARVPVSLIGRIEVVEGSSYLMQVTGLESGNHFGSYKARMQWNPFNITVRSQDGTAKAGVPVRITDLAGNELAEAKTNLQGSAELRVENLGPFMTRIGTEQSGIMTSYLDSMNMLAGPHIVTLPSDRPISSQVSENPSEGAGFGIGSIPASFLGLSGIVVVILAYVVISSHRQRSMSPAT
ncbi:MAG: hypothetical protein HYW93_07955 [Thaumarchaeota archaeon]|nr:hypothetical protein [Nitrososphaerota archaeon]